MLRKYQAIKQTLTIKQTLSQYSCVKMPSSQYLKTLLLFAFFVFSSKLNAHKLNAQVTTVYVSTVGTIISSGESSDPVNIERAFEIASTTSGSVHLMLDTGIYEISTPLEIVTDLMIEGGFLSGDNWTKSDGTYKTTIERNLENIEGATGNERIMAFWSNGTRDFALIDLKISTFDATGLLGVTNYGLHLNSCADYRIVRCEIQAGDGGNGTSGIDGVVGEDGLDGEDGTPMSSCSANGTGTAGGIGGAGGGGTLAGEDGVGRNGGGGSTGGKGGNVSTTSGSPGANSLSPGMGGGNPNNVTGVNGSGSGDGPANGLIGNDGENGQNGSNGTVAAPQFLEYYDIGIATDGQNGTGGSGASGGGGGGAHECFWCENSVGNGAGGGGGGGQGGTAGTAGTSGGGSFGIYLVNNLTRGELINSQIMAGNPGLGGAGGTGMNGGVGGLGGIGPDPCTSRGGGGGQGGIGGAGGAGGKGGDGLDGFAQDVYVQSGEPVVNLLNQTITFDEVISKTYGDPNFTLNAVSSSGLIVTYDSSDPGIASVTGNNVEILGAGTIQLIARQEGDETYGSSESMQTLVINKVPLTTIVTDATKVYGEENPAFTIDYSGFVNGDDASMIDVKPTGTANATALTWAGTVNISVEGGSDNNYTFDVVEEGELTVTKRTLTVIASDKTKMYGEDNPLLSATYIGFVNGNSENDLDVLPVVSTTATALTQPGEVALILTGGSDNNYEYQIGSGKLTITKRPLLALAVDQKRSYGEDNSLLDISYIGFVNGETEADLNTAPTASTIATNFSEVGEYEITLSTGSDIRYDIAELPGTLTVEKRSLVAVANDKTKLFGEDNPALTISYVGFANGNTDADLDSSPTASTLADVTSIVGSYAIELTEGLDSNYDITEVPGTLTVEKIGQVIAFIPFPDNVSIHTSDFEISAIASSNLDVTFTSSNPALASISDNVVSIHAAGEVTITANQAGDSNYDPALPALQTLLINATSVLGINPTNDLIEIYPNPVSDYFELAVNGNSPIKIELLSISGQTIRSFEYRPNVIYDLEGLMNGTYIMRATFNDFIWSGRIIVK